MAQWISIIDIKLSLVCDVYLSRGLGLICLIGWSVGLLGAGWLGLGCLIGWLDGWLVNCLVGLLDWLFGLVGWLVVCVFVFGVSYSVDRFVFLIWVCVWLFVLFVFMQMHALNTRSMSLESNITESLVSERKHIALGGQKSIFKDPKLKEITCW